MKAHVTNKVDTGDKWTRSAVAFLCGTHKRVGTHSWISKLQVPHEIIRDILELTVPRWEVEVTDTGQLFTTLNYVNNTVAPRSMYPSEESFRKSGRSGWNGWSPKVRTKGAVIARLEHSSHRGGAVLLVKCSENDLYFVIDERGVKRTHLKDTTVWPAPKKYSWAEY
ncbi:hypothetical protein Pelo_3987 [Pelomyxa schiedti]|nr:hypothetical protein Pelo_3987 [Pelomyxa schiedti]